MSEPLPKGELTKAFHREMIGLAYKQVELMVAIRQAVANGHSEDEIDAGISSEARVVCGIRADYYAQLQDLSRRFDAARIGNFLEHLEQSGAMKIIKDDLKRAP